MLIRCPDCQTEVSDQALQCVKCGRPMAAAREAGRSTEAAITTQATAKRYKAQMLVGVAILIVGVFMMVGSETGGDGRVWGAVLFLAGLVLYLGARFRAWWANG